MMVDINKETNVHFIAIGGVGMSALAKYLVENGYSVSGSDITESKYFKMLKEMGAKVFLGHNEENLSENSVVIASTAIKDGNPEIIKAKKLGLPILHRSDLLKIISKNFQEEQGKFIGFSGTHGKTTTSGLCSYVLDQANMQPSYVVGGIIPDVNTNAKSSKGNLFVAELDESDGTILKYTPDITVINNLEVDHIDFYTDGMRALQETFDKFIFALPNTSKLLMNNDCDGVCELIKKHCNKNIITYGLEAADYVAKNISYSSDVTKFSIFYKDKFVTDIELSVLGKHNVYNALAVAVALIEVGIEIQKLKEHFKTFSGMGRRYQLVSEFDGIRVVDDYAHHPSEIKATLECAKQNNPNSRIVAVFQPHRYTRLHGLYSEFLNSFDNSDFTIVLDTFSASEQPIDGHTSEEFAKELSEKSNAVYIGGKIQDVSSLIVKYLKPNDLVLTLGAGDVTKLGVLIKDAYSDIKEV